MAKPNQFATMTLEQLHKELLSLRLRRHARKLDQTHFFSQIRREIARRHTNPAINPSSSTEKSS